MALIPYAIFLVSGVLMFTLRHRLKFWGEWSIGFGAGILNAVLSLVLPGTDIAMVVSGFIVPLFFMIIALAIGRGFDKFVANSMMLILAIIPLPWSLVGVLGTAVVVLVYAFVASPAAKASAMNFYYLGTNVVGMLISLRDTKTAEGDDNKHMNPWIVFLFVMTPSLLTALAYI